MTQPQQVALTRLSEELAAMSHQMYRVSGQLHEVGRLLAYQGTAPAAPAAPPAPAVPAPPAAAPVRTPVKPPAAYLPPAPTAPPAERLGAGTGPGWIPKVLAVAGVAVTLIGVVLMLVLAAQAGILRPEIRVAAGAVLAGVLTVVAVRLNGRAGGRTGAIALAATGIAAAYMDVVAVTTIYEWFAPAAGLVLAAAIGAGGLVLARWWDSQQLGLLVMVPLLLLAPVLTGGVTLLLIGFLMALAAATLPVQLGRDWIWLHGSRIAAVVLPLLFALLTTAFGVHVDLWLLGAGCGIAALLSVLAALLLLPSTTNRTAMALLTAAGTTPALAAGITVDRMLAALLAAAVSVGMLAIVLVGARLPGGGDVVTRIWSALAAVSAMIAVTVAFDGYVAAPVLLALAVVVAVAGRRESVARWAAIGFAVLGALLLSGYAPPSTLVLATELDTPVAVSVLMGSVLLIAVAVLIARVPAERAADAERSARWGAAAAVCTYAVTLFTVTAGVLVGGPDAGFLAGQMTATMCWIAMAAALFVIALRVGDRDARTAPIAGGLALTAAATAKLFLFDLGTLDGMFRVAAFIVVGLVLLGMGAGYARSLAQQDRNPAR
ncbi:MAG: DUF2339 domain-containing protein [Mycobacterium sp.]|nr:DUF2339 domain-containing protein [Mycobacterium sp.]